MEAELGVTQGKTLHKKKTSTGTSMFQAIQNHQMDMEMYDLG